MEFFGVFFRGEVKFDIKRRFIFLYSKLNACLEPPYSDISQSTKTVFYFRFLLICSLMLSGVIINVDSRLLLDMSSKIK